MEDRTLLSTPAVSRIEIHRAQSGTITGQFAQGPVTTSPPELEPSQTPDDPHEHGSLPDPTFQRNYAGTVNTAPTAPATNAATITTQSTGDYRLLEQTPVRPSAGNYSATNEPSVGTLDDVVFQTGNWYAAVSGNGGSSFSYVNPYTTFPATWGGFCCDQRVAHDPNRDMLLWYLQYVKTGNTSSDTNGVRVARANTAQEVLSNSWVTYDFTPNNFGLGTGKWLDFPHMQVSGSFAYFTSNVFSSTTDQYAGTVLWRVSLSELEAGGTINFQYLNTSSGSIGLATGAGNTMYAATVTGANSLRVYTWADSSGSVTTNDVSGLSTTYMTTHNSLDNNGRNWTGRSDSRVQTGWVSGNRVGFMWNSAQGGSFPKPFVRSVVLDASSKAVVSQPDVWHNSITWHFPAISANARGDLGGTIGYNEANGPVGTQILIDDGYTTGWQAQFGTVGSDGPMQDRWGDYLGAQADDNFRNTWIATGFSHSAGVTTPHFFWFGREEDTGPDLVGSYFSTLAGANFGQTVSLNYEVRNNGYLSAGGYQVNFYLSSDSTISTSDRLLDSQTFSSLAGGVSTGILQKSLTLPGAGDPFWSGDRNYWLGMIVDVNGQQLELRESNNSNFGTGQDSQQVFISAVANDPDDQISEAIPVPPSGVVTGQIVNLLSSQDVDMYSFAAAANQRLIFDLDQDATNGLSDSYLRVFNGSGQQWAFNDDGLAPGEPQSLDSYLEYTFTTAGTYYVGVSGHPNTNYDPITGTGDVPNSSGGYTLNVIPVIPQNQPPVVNDQAFSIAENLANVTVGTVAATDPNAGQTLQYAITAGNTGGLFTINSATGEIRVGNTPLDFEAQSQYQLTVQVTDNGTPALSDTAIITVNVTDQPEGDPNDQISEAVLVTGASVSGRIDPGTDVDMFRLNVTAANDRWQLDLDRPAGSLDSWLRIFNAAGQQLAFNDDGPTPGETTSNESYLDYTFATAGAYYIGVSGFGNSSYDAVTGNGDGATDVLGDYVLNFARVVTQNQPPVINPQTFAIAENRSVGYVVGTVVATDPDSGQTLSYAITAGNTNAVFAINAATGQLTVAKATIDFETLNQYNLNVQVTDSGNPALSSSATVTVNINNLNEAPVFLAPTTFTMSENRSVGYVVGTVRAVDPEMQTITYSLISGDTNAQFALNATTGQLTVAKATIDFETKSQYILQVKAQDNGNPVNSRTQNITVNVANLNEPPVFLTPMTFTVPAGSPNGTVVGTVRTVDPEGNAVSYLITAGNTNNAFAINATSGQITVANSSALNFATTPQFLLSVKATDNGSPSNNRTQTITVNLTNVNQPPNFTGPTTFTIPENRPRGYLVGTVTAVDPEGTAVNYAITAGNTNSAFVINASTGQITVSNRFAVDYETTPRFLLSVRATDSGNPAASRTQTITINLTNTIGRVPANAGATAGALTAQPSTTNNGQQVVTASPPVATPTRSPEPAVKFKLTIDDTPAVAARAVMAFVLKDE